MTDGDYSNGEIFAEKMTENAAKGAEAAKGGAQILNFQDFAKALGGDLFRASGGNANRGRSPPYRGPGRGPCV